MTIPTPEEFALTLWCRIFRGAPDTFDALVYAIRERDVAVRQDERAAIDLLERGSPAA